MHNALEIKNLSKKYIGFSLDNINFHIPAGKVLGLVGENGAGKSTTTKAILDMVQRDSGEIIILGKDNRNNLKLTLISKKDLFFLMPSLFFCE